jgi:hypothetical protein
MNESDPQAAVVFVQSNSLARRAAMSLAKRGLGDLQLLESADAWFEKAINARLDCRPAEYFELLQRTIDLNPRHLGVQLKLAEAYLFGEGVPEDFSQSAAWYRKAAEQGNADAQFKLGEMYGNGEGVPQDHAQATRHRHLRIELEDHGRQAMSWMAAPLSLATPESNFLSSQREFKRNWFVLQVPRPSKHCRVNEGRFADALCASAGVDVAEDVNLWVHSLNGGE